MCAPARQIFALSLSLSFSPSADQEKTALFSRYSEDELGDNDEAKIKLCSVLKTKVQIQKKCVTAFIATGKNSALPLLLLLLLPGRIDMSFALSTCAQPLLSFSMPLSLFHTRTRPRSQFLRIIFAENTSEKVKTLSQE